MASENGKSALPRQLRKNLLRYIHTQSYSRISGFRGAKMRENIVRNQLFMVIIAFAVFSLGLWFVCF
ncbi:MAG: hypothetical protein WC071_12770 [Victivallaceae bacterium]